MLSCCIDQAELVVYGLVFDGHRRSQVSKKEGTQRLGACCFN